MDFVTLLLLALGLSMDVFAVSVCKGLAMKRPKAKHVVIIGLWFGIFQAVMPAIGFFAGSVMGSFIKNAVPWIAFVLLALVGLNMIREAFFEEEKIDGSIDFKVMLILAIATSIDAMAAGVFLSSEGSPILLSVLVIGIVSFAMAAIGVKIGSVFGTKYSKPAKVAGGIILIALGVAAVLI